MSDILKIIEAVEAISKQKTEIIRGLEVENKTLKTVIEKLRQELSLDQRKDKTHTEVWT